MASDLNIKVVRNALSALENEPKSLSEFLAFFGKQLTGKDCISVDELLGHATNMLDLNDPIRLVFHQKLSKWDYATSADWIANTEPNTPERRLLIYKLIGLTSKQATLVDNALPFFVAEHTTVIAAEHTAWYDSGVGETGYYWNAYREYLAQTGSWSDDSLLALEESTRAVVERLSKPSRAEAFQTKGLAVGYVQSGKTANFTGVAARAADAGYRLIIILAGTTDILRRQTQRRLDKEMIGREFLLQDYQNDNELESFIQHGTRPSQLGFFDWQRLTGPVYDYRSLKHGIDALEFEKANAAKPFYAVDNTSRSKARLIVIKKNSIIMKKVIGDLQQIRSRLEDIPALVIDDESDQASLNTRRADETRTAVNACIVQLLKILPRGQYVGYTATPFANVFVDPSQPEDLFPKDFLISLPRPPDYMGVSDFYDLDPKSDDDPSSNKNCFIRDIEGDDDSPGNLERAIDSFVLTGALKLFRRSNGVKVHSPHHTMLVHLSHLKSDHADQVSLVERFFRRSDYRAGNGYARLEHLYNSDFLPKTKLRNPSMSLPKSFSALSPFIAEALARISDGKRCALMVNSDADAETPDFDAQPVWKIIVGGSKLSRGYTIEGLTISYYRRSARTADTLMQMGRWFGFRQGYSDLVRLFLGRKEPVRKDETIDLYEAFGAACRDEEMFREQLKQYSSMRDPRVLPIQVPPLVPSHLLPPTATNKMFNAKVTYQNYKKQWVERTMLPTKKEAAKENWNSFVDMLMDASLVRHTASYGIEDDGETFDFYAASIGTEKVAAFIAGYKWLGNNPHLAQRELAFINGKGNRAPGIDNWLIIIPQHGKPHGEADPILNGKKLSVFERGRIDDARVGVITEPRHRLLAEYVTLGARNDGNKPPISSPSKSMKSLYRQRQAVLLCYPTRTSKSNSSEQVQPGFALFFPDNDVKSPLVTFSVADPTNRTAVIVKAKV
jgi:hypothetical protein